MKGNPVPPLLLVLGLGCGAAHDADATSGEREAAASPDAGDAADGSIATARHPDASPPDGPRSDGACDKPKDMHLFDTHADLDVDAESPGCVMPRVLAGSGPGSDGFTEGVADCLSEATGLSLACTTCYAHNAECSFEACGILCLPDRESSACRDCRCGRTGHDNCFAKLQACSGLATDYCD